MKYLYAIGILWALISRVSAQTTVLQSQTEVPRVINLTTLAAQEEQNPPLIIRKIGNQKAGTTFQELPIPANAIHKVTDIAPTFTSPDTQDPLPNSPLPSQNFLGLDDNGTSIPPDVNGAVGVNHLMVTLNTQVRVQQRNGDVVSTVSLNSFWSAFTNSPFDPRILYDRLAQRWIFIAVADGSNANSSVLIGASQTNDPTQNWNLYEIDADPNNVNWFDYPCVGYNKDWIVITGNMFPLSGAGNAGTQIYVLNKADLYAGNGATFTRFNNTNTEGFTLFPATTYSNTLDRVYMLQNWNSTSLRLTEISGSVNNPSFVSLGFISASNQSWSFSMPENVGPQRDDVRGIHTNDARLHAVVYRNNSLWATHSVFLPQTSPNRAAAQWWQINPLSLETQQFGRIDDPNAARWYIFPSLDVNLNNDVLIGYTSLSEDQYPSASYSVRYSTTTANTMLPEQVYREGVAPYFKTFGGTRNRWGDYTSTIVDPVNDLDIWTLQQFADAPVGSGVNSSRWSTQWAKVNFGSSAFINTSALASNILCAGRNISVGFTTGGNFGTNNEFSLQLSDATGNFANAQTLATAAQSPISTTIPASTPAGAAYRVRVVSTNPVVIGGNNGQNISIANASRGVSNLQISNDTFFELNVSWTSGDGEGRIVLIKPDTDILPSELPVDGRSYIAVSTYAGGGDFIGNAYVAYRGNGSSVRIRGLEQSKNYFVAVVEFTCNPPRYLTQLVSRTTQVVTDTEALISKSVKLYPNPVSSKFKIAIDNLPYQPLQVDFVDELGRVVVVRRLNVDEPLEGIDFDTAELAKGVYTLRLQFQERIICKKLVVR